MDDANLEIFVKVLTWSRDVKGSFVNSGGKGRELDNYCKMSESDGPWGAMVAPLSHLHHDYLSTDCPRVLGREDTDTGHTRADGPAWNGSAVVTSTIIPK